MPGSIFVTETQSGNGKSTICLGLISLLERTLGKVGYFKPIGNKRNGDNFTDVHLMKDALGLRLSFEEMGPLTMDQVTEALTRGTYDNLLDNVLDTYQRIADQCDFVVIEGTDYEGAMATFEFDINAELSKNLGSPILLVANAADCICTNPQDGQCMANVCETLIQRISFLKENFDAKSCEMFGVVINRVESNMLKNLQPMLQKELEKIGIRLIGILPRSDMLEKPSLEEIAADLGAEVLSGHERLNTVVQGFDVAAMSLENVLKRLFNGVLALVPGDREEVLLGLAAAYRSTVVASPSGIVMTGGLEPPEKTKALLTDITGGLMPILKVNTKTFETAVHINEVKAKLKSHQTARIEIIKGLVERQLNVDPLITRSAVGEMRANRMTPKQFIHSIVDIARKNRRRIVLPEGVEERILKAAEVLLDRQIVDLTILGDEEQIRQRSGRLGLKLEGAHILDPAKAPMREAYAKRYIELRSPKKTPTWEIAWDIMSDPTYFGTMMVYEGHADGMVSGSINTTAHTLRPALEFIKCKEGFSIASSVFFMCLPNSVLVFGDCAVVPNPTEDQLANIAIASADTAKSFEIEPRVAMLSYSTGASGGGPDVEKVRKATEIVRELRPDILVEGPIQYDAAIDPGVAKTKLPNSKVAGTATVFIFPDLNTGNNTYKAVQRASNGIAIGPVMQGLKKPVNDLSRGCTIPDIINTVAITAVQAQSN